MFFGAGNVVFPLLLGVEAKTKIPLANIGLLITSIGGPLLGLFSAILFKGNFKEFFCRIGKVPGYLLMILTSLLLGPFAVMPRCLVVAFASLESFLGNLSIFPFSFIISGIIFLLIYKKNNVLSVLGSFLSPILIGSLLIIIIRALFLPGYTEAPSISNTTAFKLGLITGYDTMDLIASIFFSVSIWTLLKTRLKLVDHKVGARYEIKAILASGAIAGILLGLIYTGFSLSTATHSLDLINTEPERLLTTLAYKTLGPVFGGIANIAIALACLTTIMGLTVTFSEIIRKDFHLSKIPHSTIALLLLAVTALFSNLGFSKIMAFIHPTVELFYPAIIVLTICNAGSKLFNFKPIKIPFYATLALTFALKHF